MVVTLDPASILVLLLLSLSRKRLLHTGPKTKKMGQSPQMILSSSMLDRYWKITKHSLNRDFRSVKFLEVSSQCMLLSVHPFQTKIMINSRRIFGRKADARAPSCNLSIRIALLQTPVHGFHPFVCVTSCCWILLLKALHMFIN